MGGSYVKWQDLKLLFVVPLLIYPCPTLAQLGPLVLGWGNIIDIAFSPNGEFLAIASVGGSVIQVLSTSDWSTVVSLQADTFPTSIVFTPNGESIISGHHDGTVRVWSLAEGSCRMFRAHEEKHRDKEVQAVAIENNGNLVASSYGWDGIKIWDLATEKILEAQTDNTRHVFSMVFVSKQALVGGNSKGKVFLWEFGKKPRVLYHHADAVNRVIHHPFGYIISASDDKTLIIFDLASGKVRWSLALPNYIRAVSLHPNGEWLVVGTYKRALVWDFQHDQIVKDLAVVGWVSGISCHPKGDRVAIATWDGNVFIWDLVSGKANIIPKINFGDSAALSPDGSRLVTEFNKKILVYNLDPPFIIKERAIKEGEERSVYRFSWDPTGQYIVSCGERLIVWEASDLEPIEQFDLSDWAYEARFSGDGKHVVVRASDKVSVCDLSRSSCQTIRLDNQLQENRIDAVAISPQGEKLVMALSPKSWQSDKKEKLILVELANNSQELLAVGYFDQVIFGKEVVVALGDRILILDLTGKKREIDISLRYTENCLLTEEGLLFCSVWNEIVVVDVVQGKTIERLKGHNKKIYSLALNKAGYLVSVSADGTIRFWDVRKLLASRWGGEG